MKREYLTPGFGHLLGYVSYPKKDDDGNYYDTDITGLAGVEAAFNGILAGKNGTLLTEEDARGRVQSQGTVQPPVNGNPVTLSIDARAQKAFYDAISSLADKTPFQGGAAVLMGREHRRGACTRFVPGIRPEHPVRRQPADTIAGYATDSRQPYLDRAISGLYTPGSIVKPIEASGVLTDKVISPDKIIYSSGSISLRTRTTSRTRAYSRTGRRSARSTSAMPSPGRPMFILYRRRRLRRPERLGISRLEYWFNTFGYTTQDRHRAPAGGVRVIPSPEWKKETFGDDWRIGDTYPPRPSASTARR